MHIKKGDKVQIISGEYKGHVGEVLKAFPKTNRVIVEGANVQIKHQKATTMGGESGRLEQNGPIDASNVLLYSEELKKGVRTGIVYENGKKVRKSKKTDEKFD
ncbi:50S ribosomal protein L24 [Anaerococcus lactolyticus]|uniref:Large ribosomal subunit protein uL24 n=2 Tax=Anaerococcus lactolyticus TaxID=33032 RepID=C2BEZ7_9FIRM|nr:50S ribosomal protein L24 [Anaerococcus lactolyticus]EEI86528.1 ribosomal protein L24 [Anaerococcus lactolyticus ATCC 51172]KGF04513.1 50S ribosomal protein L24 [Anaerococcus lactolyticus S7-1-13]